MPERHERKIAAALLLALLILATQVDIASAWHLPPLWWWPWGNEHYPGGW